MNDCSILTQHSTYKNIRAYPKIPISTFLSRYEPIEIETDMLMGMNGSINTYFDREINTVVAVKTGNINESEVLIGCVTKHLQIYTNSLNYSISWGNIKYENPSFAQYDNFYIVMPLLDGPMLYLIKDINNDTFELGMLFELAIAIFVATRFGYFEHADLNPGNILTKKVDYNRIYKINDIEYIISSPHIPVIIDYGKVNFSTNSKTKRDEFGSFIIDSSDLDVDERWSMAVLSSNIYPFYKRNINFNNGLYDIINAPEFNQFTNISIDSGKSYKFFEPVYCYKL